MRRFDARTLALGALAVAIVVLTGVLGIAFARTQQTERVAEAAARQLVSANAVRLTESLDSRAEGALITLAAHQADLTGDAELETAIESVREAHRAVLATDIEFFEQRFGIETAAFVELLEAGDLDGARLHLDTQIDPLAEAVTAQANAANADAAEVIAVETGVAGRWGLVTSFGVGLFTPLIALMTFRSIARRRRERDRLETELEKAKEVAETKDAMIGHLSHELRTPLTGILGFAMTMDDMGFDDAELAAEMNQMILGEAGELSRMVEDLLVAAKTDADGLNFSPAEMGVQREVDEVLVTFASSSKNITTDVEDTPVLADRLRTRHVIRNLVSNAVKHGGDNISITGRSSMGRYALMVTDDGPGIPDDVQAGMFDRFVNEDDTLTKGSVGVGLSVASTLAAGMNAQLTYDGTSFVLSLPLAHSEDVALEAVTPVVAVAPPPTPASPVSAPATPIPGASPTRSTRPAPPPAPTAPRPEPARQLLPADPFATV